MEDLGVADTNSVWSCADYGAICGVEVVVAMLCHLPVFVYLLSLISIGVWCARWEVLTA